MVRGRGHRHLYLSRIAPGSYIRQAFQEERSDETCHCGSKRQHLRIPVLGQGRGQAPAPAPPATGTVTPEISGVARAGTRVIVIKDDLQGTEGPIALPDGTLAFTEGGAGRISRIDKDDKVAAYCENTNGSNALGFDSRAA